MRGKQAPRRTIDPDTQYNSVPVSRFINQVMRDGKKSTAQRLVYHAFALIKERSGKEPLEVFEQALRNVEPSVEVKSRRIGGANYQIPIEVRGNRRETLAMRWLILGAKGRKARGMSEGLAAEFLDAIQGQGEAFKKKEDVRRMAEANRAFAHFA